MSWDLYSHNNLNFFLGWMIVKNVPKGQVWDWFLYNLYNKLYWLYWGHRVSNRGNFISNNIKKSYNNIVEQIQFLLSQHQIHLTSYNSDQSWCYYMVFILVLIISLVQTFYFLQTIFQHSYWKVSLQVEKFDLFPLDTKSPFGPVHQGYCCKIHLWEDASDSMARLDTHFSWKWIWAHHFLSNLNQ